MVKGIDKFKSHFEKHKNKFVIIGGTACSILMNEVHLEFRVTKDIDIIILIEVIDAEFGKDIWKFIKDANYKNIHKSTGKKEFYRFYEPEDNEYPFMIELFTKRTNIIELPEDLIISPLHIDDEISSLSAILIEEDYYNFISRGVSYIKGLPILNAEYLIPMKIKAFKNLSEMKSNNVHVDEKNIRKHKNDIFRLYTILTPNTKLKLPKIIEQDVIEFLDEIILDSSYLMSLDIKNSSTDKVLDDLKLIYQLK